MRAPSGFWNRRQPAFFCSEKMLIECCVQRTPQIWRMELPVSMTARNFGIMCSIFAINASASTVRGDVIA